MPEHTHVKWDEVQVLIALGVGLAIFGPALAALRWAKTVRWMISEGLIVAAESHPLIMLPSSGGAGLDLARLAVIAAVVLAVTAVSATMIKRRRRLAREART